MNRWWMLTAAGVLATAAGVLATAVGVQAAATTRPSEEPASKPTSQPAHKEWTLPSGEKIIQLREGEGDREAKDGDIITVHYTGRLANGKKFDSSRDRGKPFVFRLGAHQVIPGWEQGIKGMKVGEVRELIIPPELAYGERGVPGAIPPKATLTFNVELLGLR